jgi:hypothetical protein
LQELDLEMEAELQNDVLLRSLKSLPVSATGAQIAALLSSSGESEDDKQVPHALTHLHHNRYTRVTFVCVIR